MSADIKDRLRAEVDLIERFTQTYRRKFDAVIERLNGSGGPSDLQCVRLCVEAVNMLLTSQAQVARTIRAMAEEGEGGEGVRRAA